MQKPKNFISVCQIGKDEVHAIVYGMFKRKFEQLKFWGKRRGWGEKEKRDRKTYSSDKEMSFLITKSC